MNEPIRVLHVLQRMEAAGVQSFLMNIYRNIDRERVQFDFLVHYTEPQFYDEEIKELGGKVYKLSFREDKNIIKYCFDLKNFFAKHQEYRIVHGHMDSLGCFYLRAAKKAGVPCRIAHSHNVLIGGDIKKRIRNIFNRFYKYNATKLLACSDTAGKYMFGGSPFKVIHNPIDVYKFSFNQLVRNEVRKEFNFKKTDIVIGHVGRFSQQKNHEFLVDVFIELLQKLNTVKLLLVGQGELENRIRQKIYQKGIKDRVVFAGTRKDVNRVYQAMDAFVFPSTYEGLGIVAIEAQAAGLPTICSDRVPQMANVTDKFYSIPLSKSPKIWAQCIFNMISVSDRSSVAHSLIEAGYDVSTVKSELINFYESELKIFR